MHSLNLDSTHPPLRIGPQDRDASLMEAARAEARREDDDPARGRALARRLLIAFFACAGIALACFVLVPQWAGVHVPAWVPLLSFLAIAAGTALTAPPAPPPACCAGREDEGRPIGCCSGPRPLRVPQDRG